MGKNHVRIYSELKDSELVAIADINSQRAKEIGEMFNVNYYSSHLQLLQDEEVDAISVSTPTSTHYDICKDILNSRKHVLVEKPIASNREQAKKMIDLSKKNGILLMVGHIERFNPAVLKLKELLMEDFIGKIISLSARRVGYYKPEQRTIFDVVVDFSIHDIDVMRFLVEREIKSVYSKTKSILSQFEDYVSAILEFDNGISGIIESNLFTPTKIRTMQLTGTKGYAELDFINQDIMIYGNIEKEGQAASENQIFKYSNTIISRPFVAKNEPLKLELEHFLDCIISNKTPLTDGSEGLKNLEVAEMIMLSSKKNMPVNIVY